jgi:hypothetical protein
VQEKIQRLGEYPAFAGFFFHDVEPDPAELDGGGPMLAAAGEASRRSSRSRRRRSRPRCGRSRTGWA